MTLQELNDNYYYVSDIDQWGVDDLWELMEPQNGRYLGDCESYILSLIAKVDGMKDLEPWYLELTSDNKIIGHCVGKDKNTGLFIDCNYRTFVSEKVIFDGWTNTRPFTKYEIWKGVTYSKVFKFVYNKGSFGKKLAVSVANFLK